MKDIFVSHQIKHIVINRLVILVHAIFVIAFFMVACVKNEVAIEPVLAKELAHSLALRDKYETLLFNHLVARGELPMKGRFESIQKMAKDGFKPAALALALYDIEHSDLKTDDSKAEKDLENSAQSGDVTAQCLYAFYWKPEDNPKRWRQYVINSANAQVSKCMFLRARYVEQDKSKEQFDWTYKAAVMGDKSGQTLMAFAYYQGNVVQKNMDYAICWAVEVKKNGSHFDEGTYQTLMFFYRQDKQNLKASPPDAQFCHKVINNFNS